MKRKLNYNIFKIEYYDIVKGKDNCIYKLHNERLIGVKDNDFSYLIEVLNHYENLVFEGKLSNMSLHKMQLVNGRLVDIVYCK